jgi:predicted nucleic acid-binding protein
MPTGNQACAQAAPRVTLVDTSVWIEFFRSGNQKLEQLLDAGSVLMHPFILGELACGNLKPRGQILEDLHALPAAVVAQDAEVLYFIEQHQLMGEGIGYLDAHLLVSTQLSVDAHLWTRDKKLSRAAARVMPIH